MQLAEANAEARKKQLEGLEMRNCQDLTNDELARIVQANKKTILDLFRRNHRPRAFPTIDGIQYDWLTIGAANIVSEKQHQHGLNEIENVRDAEERGTLCDSLHEIAMPFVLIAIFKYKFGLSTQEAHERVMLQEEKAALDFPSANLI